MKEYFIKNHLFLSFIFNEYSGKQKFPRNVKFLISKFFVIDNWLEEKNLRIVEKNGLDLQFVKEQTENICLKAVEKNGKALKYVKEKQKRFVSKPLNNMEKH